MVAAEEALGGGTVVTVVLEMVAAPEVALVTAAEEAVGVDQALETTLVKVVEEEDSMVTMEEEILEVTEAVEETKMMLVIILDCSNHITYREGAVLGEEARAVPWRWKWWLWEQKVLTPAEKDCRSRQERARGVVSNAAGYFETVVPHALEEL